MSQVKITNQDFCIKVAIQDFCQRLVKTVSGVCVIKEDEDTSRSYRIDGEYIEFDCSKNSIGIIYTYDDDGLDEDETEYWYYYDEELDCYELPSESFVRRLCLLIFNLKNKETDEYNACVKLTKICEEANIGF